ncbi:MAG TPA: YbdD/YjiX family protein [Gemmatimonadaceae bacterium]|nr:YbdD/YjiX family protein [Gemmatimonadaceae bacterium]
MTIATLGALVTKVGRALAVVAGAPDYERYLAHMRSRHPDETPLSAAELLARRNCERLERPGGRCC